eukprot:3011431-Amphidinium_carterae.1
MLEKKNLYIGTIQRPDSYYERGLLQEMMQTSYVKFHPTSGYHRGDRATPTMKWFYVESTTGSRSTTSTTNTIHNDQWMTRQEQQRYNNYFQAAITTHKRFSTLAMKDQKLTNLRELGMEDEQTLAHEEIVKKEKIMELYIVLPEKRLTCGYYEDVYLDHSLRTAQTQNTLGTTSTLTSSTRSMISSTSTCTTSRTTTRNKDNNF